jgi:alkylation response protein AidB-like acyl-CoA dehydrogenase
MSFSATSARAAAAVAEIATLAPRTAVEGPWLSGALAALGRHGVLAEFVPATAGGSGASEPEIVATLAAVAEQCLTTALALSQWAAAVRIIAGSAGPAQAMLPALARGEAFTTVGISQLTTSRQHAAAPALVATPDGAGWRLDGLCPWVTGADSVQTIVTGAVTEAGGRAFFVVPTAAAGVETGPPLDLLALGGSRTAEVRFRDVWLRESIPAVDAPRTGGLATTALALGSTRAAIALVHAEAAGRPALEPIVTGLRAEADAIAARLDAAAREGIEPAARDRLRADATSLVVRAAQAALTAAKGAGFVRGHPAERLARESLFFLVWSCPQAVSGAVLCELAGLG